MVIHLSVGIDLSLSSSLLRRKSSKIIRLISNLLYQYLFVLQEEEYICRVGLHTGYTGGDGSLGPLDELGAGSAGVFLSLHPDACTPAPLTEGIRMRILMCKARIDVLFIS